MHQHSIKLKYILEGFEKMISLSNVSRQINDNPSQVSNNLTSYNKSSLPFNRNDSLTMEEVARSRKFQKLYYEKINRLIHQISSSAICKNHADCFHLQNYHIQKMDVIMRTIFSSSWDEVKEFFETQKLKPYDQQSSIKFILAYRDRVVHDTLNEVKKELPTEIIKQKINFLNTKNIHPSDPLFEKFLKLPLKPFSWFDYGSKDPSSDLDVTLKGDYTQYAVKLFNEKIYARFDQKEPGLLFDANVYSENCIPEINKNDFSQNLRKDFLRKKNLNFDHLPEEEVEDYFTHNIELSKQYNSFLDKTKKQPSYQKFMNFDNPILKAEINRSNALESRELKKDILDFYEIQSLAKVRRYMNKEEWKDFRSQLVDVFKNNELELLQIKRKLLKAELNYFNNIASVKNFLSQFCALDEVNTKGPRLKTGEGYWKDLVLQNELNESFIKRFSPNLLMRAENRIYEDKLLKSSQYKMNLDWYDMLNPHDSKGFERENLLVSLEKSQCESKYFANEAYVTPASLISVVINKQMLSRGLYPQKQFKEKYFKIPLSPQEHLISLNEQLGDFLKEATRNLKTPNFHAIEDAVGLKSGKYLHRYANSYQSLYETMDQAKDMQLTSTQLKSCTNLEMLKKDPRPLEHKAQEIRDSINQIFFFEKNSQNHRTAYFYDDHKSPQQAWRHIRKGLIDIHLKAYVDHCKKFPG